MKVPQAKVQLTIDFDPSNGNVSLHGPIQNRMLCYGLLGFAHEIIAQQANQPAPKSSIVIPQIHLGGNGL